MTSRKMSKNFTGIYKNLIFPILLISNSFLPKRKSQLETLNLNQGTGLSKSIWENKYELETKKRKKKCIRMSIKRSTVIKVLI